MLILHKVRFLSPEKQNFFDLPGPGEKNRYYFALRGVLVTPPFFEEEKPRFGMFEDGFPYALPAVLLFTTNPDFGASFLGAFDLLMILIFSVTN